MQLYPLKQVTVVVEEILKDQIQVEVLDLGATGYTTRDVVGHGSRNTRHSSVIESNVQIDFIVPEDVAVKIMTHISRKYFENYACIAWVSNVDVVRGDRFIKRP